MINLYDIKLDSDKRIYLELITLKNVSLYDENTKRNTSYLEEVNREIEYPEDLKKRINYLRAIGFNSVISFFPRTFNLINLNPLNNLMVAIIEKGHILLDIVYDDKEISEDNLNVVAIYIHYIDPNTGIEYAKRVAVRKDITSAELLESGYTPIENSILMAHINEIHNQDFAILLDNIRSEGLTQK